MGNSRGGREVEGWAKGEPFNTPAPAANSPRCEGMTLFTFRRGRSRRTAWAKPPAVQAPWASRGANRATTRLPTEEIDAGSGYKLPDPQAMLN